MMTCAFYRCTTGTKRWLTRGFLRVLSGHSDKQNTNIPPKMSATPNAKLFVKLPLFGQPYDTFSYSIIE